MGFSWQCPHCGHHSTITRENYSSFQNKFDHGNKDGASVLVTAVIICPNSNCRDYTIDVNLLDFAWKDDGLDLSVPARQRWALRPDSQAKPMPEYIPPAIVRDYEEACRIRDLSPKASATLARRCLQGMIRDFHGVSEGSLAKEIEKIRDSIDPVTWDSINAVRKIGNIGAHMEKDINVIVDVEPGEAALLIGLIESLVQDWYVARQQRAERHAAIQALAAQKEAARKVEATQSPKEATG